MHLRWFNGDWMAFMNRTVPRGQLAAPDDTATYPFHSREELEALHRAAFADLTYQNMIIQNRTHLLFAIDEGDQALEVLSQIVEMLATEIAAK